MVKEVEIKDIRQLNDKSLLVQVEKFRKELFNMKLTNTMGAIKNPHQMKILKKNIARLLTILSLNKKRGVK